MAVNLDKPHRWKADIIQSVDMYNDWFVRFAPRAFRETRFRATLEVEAAMDASNNLQTVDVATLRAHPEILATLRMSTCPPLAVDRLVGLAGVSRSLVKRMESHRMLPVRPTDDAIDQELRRIVLIIGRMADPDIFVWLGRSDTPTTLEIRRAATIVADRLCGSVANPIIRNEQEKRQLAAVGDWLKTRGYHQITSSEGLRFNTMPPGTFGFRMNVPVTLEGGRVVNIPIDAAVMPRNAGVGDLPVFFEAKSAGDFANVNKRRKEEATKITQLRHSYGDRVHFNLFLCGYFDSGYLGYEAAEGIDWVWEHRIDDLSQFDL